MEVKLHPTVKIANALAATSLAISGTSCAFSRNMQIPPPPATATDEIYMPTKPSASQPSETSMPSYNQIPTSTLIPTDTNKEYPTNTPEIVMERERRQVLSIMTKYGRVDERYLSDNYWDRFKERIEKNGSADRVLSLEYHGDDYNMINGSYTMTPNEFEKQMTFLMENDYHFVTGPEMLLYIQGKLKLPKKSIILTTDSGNTSFKSLPRIIDLFKKLEEKYGYSPHMLSAIWTQSMDTGETVLCKPDNKFPSRCWDIFQQAVDSEYFSFGTHSESHASFAELSQLETRLDLEGSIKEINTALGLNPYFITWPHESCSTHQETLEELGIYAGFGGRSRPIEDNFVYFQDKNPFCLPRNLPPNDGGFSSRPLGFTLEKMLNEASDPNR